MAFTSFPIPTVSLIDLSLIEIIGAGHTLLLGPSTPTAQGPLASDWIWGDAVGRAAMIAEGAIWSGKTYVGWGFAKTFDAADSSASPGTAPATSFFLYANNDGSNNDVTPLLTDANARVSNSTVFGGNLIARSNGVGLTNVKLVGLEIDVEPAVGDTVSSQSGALFINAFSSVIPVGIQFGSIFGGGFTNYIICDTVFGVDGTGAVFATGTSTTSTASSGTPTIKWFDSTDGGWTLFSETGIFRLATLSAVGGFVANIFSISAAGAGVFNGTLGVTGHVQTGTVTVAALPAPSGPLTGARLMVSDSTVATTAGIGLVVVGGGGTVVPVFCNGIEWRIG